jgi:hypothetical protein
MQSVNFHDINFWVGENNLLKKYSVSEDKLPGILEVRIKEYRIISTTITHFNSFFYWPASGNELLAGLLGNLKTSQ